MVLRHQIRALTAIILVNMFMGLARAGEEIAPPASAAADRPFQVDSLTTHFFSLIDEGTIDVKVRPKTTRSSESINVIFSNQTTEPLTIDLPPSLVATPILAQYQQQPPQSLGLATPTGSFPYGKEDQPSYQFGTNDERFGFPLALEDSLFSPQGMRGNDGGKRGPLFRSVFRGKHFTTDKRLKIDPGKTVRLSMPSVCLNYGNPDPSPKYRYELRPLVEISDSVPLRQALWLQAHGFFNQAMTQAVAWHEVNGMSWNQLLRLKSRTGSFFTYDEVLVARRLVELPQQATTRSAGWRR